MTRLQRRLWITVQGRRATALAASGQRPEAVRILAAVQQAAGNDRELAIEVARALNRIEADTALREQLDRIAAMGPAAPGDEAEIAALRRAEAMRRARALRVSGQTAEAAQIYRDVVRAGPDEVAMRSASMKRDSSPPEAILARGRSCSPGFGEKKNST